MLVSLARVRRAHHVDVGQVGIVRLDVSLQLLHKRAMRLSGVGQRLRCVSLRHTTNYADMRPGRLAQRFARRALRRALRPFLGPPADSWRSRP
jgi:hypothetical protein